MAAGLLVLALGTTACSDDDKGDEVASTAAPSAADSADRAAAVQRLVAAFAQAGGTADEACVDAALADYSPDDLAQVEQALGSGQSTPETQAVIAALSRCVSFG